MENPSRFGKDTDEKGEFDLDMEKFTGATKETRQDEPVDPRVAELKTEISQKLDELKANILELEVVVEADGSRGDLVELLESYLKRISDI